LKDRCNEVHRENVRIHREVSILTGLERPVQRIGCPPTSGVRRVSILTGLERPVQREGSGADYRRYQGFNPHRP